MPSQKKDRFDTWNKTSPHHDMRHVTCQSLHKVLYSP